MARKTKLDFAPLMGKRVLIRTEKLGALWEATVLEVSPTGNFVKLEWLRFQQNGLGEFKWLAAAQFDEQFVEELGVLKTYIPS